MNVIVRSVLRERTHSDHEKNCWLIKNNKNNTMVIDKYCDGLNRLLSFKLSFSLVTFHHSEHMKLQNYIET